MQEYNFIKNTYDLICLLKSNNTLELIKSKCTIKNKSIENKNDFEVIKTSILIALFPDFIFINPNGELELKLYYEAIIIVNKLFSNLSELIDVTLYYNIYNKWHIQDLPKVIDKFKKQILICYINNNYNDLTFYIDKLLLLTNNSYVVEFLSVNNIII